MRTLSSTAVVLLIGALGLGGCAVLPPGQLYQLQSSAPAPTRDNGPVVLLGPLTLADYLDRPTLVQRQVDGTLLTPRGLRWAGSLEDNMAQLLLRQLSSRLGSSRVTVYPDRLGLHPESQVQLGVSRLDSGPQQPAVLEAQWRVLDGTGGLRSSRIVRLEETHDGSVSDQVRAQSVLLERLGQQLADAVRPARPRAAAQPAQSEEVSNRREGVLLPTYPVPQAPRREGEVFRF